MLLGRKSHGPVQLNGGANYYARLHIPLKLRALAGKTRLIRSLETSNHSVALKRYGAVIIQLEEELAQLLKGESLQQRVDIWSEQIEGTDLGSVEQAEGALSVKDLDHNNPVHERVFKAITTGKPLPITWEKLLELWIIDRNRSKSRDLAKSSIASAETAIKEIKRYAALPSDLDRETLKRYIDDYPFRPTSLQTYFRFLSAMYQIGIYEEKLEGLNPFKQVRFTAQIKREDKRKSFTDEQIRELHKSNSCLFLLAITGMRPGEYVSRRPKDLKDGMISIQDEPDIPWQTKNDSSIRKVPMPEGFSLMRPLRFSTLINYLQREARSRFNDRLITPHSGRHTFIELSRRAGCDSLTIDAVTGHGKKNQSSKYGSYPDEVLIRETQKVWDKVDEILKTNG